MVLVVQEYDYGVIRAELKAAPNEFRRRLAA